MVGKPAPGLGVLSASRAPVKSRTVALYPTVRLSGEPDLPHPVVGRWQDLEVVHRVAQGGPALRKVQEEDLGVVEAHLLDVVVHLFALRRVRLGGRLFGQFDDLVVLVAGPDRTGSSSR